MSRRYPDLDPPFLPSHYVVVDLEATCDRRPDWARDETETIEIGAVIVDVDTLEAHATWQTLVRPVVHPQLTPFCVELTRIDQSAIDAAPPFAPALAAFVETLRPLPRPLLCSWGGFDPAQLRRDCERHALDYPYTAHWNLKSAFTQRARSRVRFGLTRALEHVGLRFEGTPHRALTDALNTARLLPHCLGQQPVERLGRRRR